MNTDLPDAVIIAMLKREVLLTRAKLHGLMYDHIMSERKLRSLKTQLRQVRRPPAFEASSLLGPAQLHVVVYVSSRAAASCESC